MFQDAYDKGVRLAKEEVFLDFIEIQYPILVELAKKQASRIADADNFQQIMRKIFSLQTTGEVEEYLLALEDGATKN